MTTAAKSVMKKRHNYEVNANGNRTYASKVKVDVMSVYRAWDKQGLEPQAYAIGEDADGKIVCDRIA